MASWLFVVGERAALDWVLGKGRMAFRDHIRTGSLAAGDGFGLYVSRGAFHNPTRDEGQLLAVGTVSSKVLHSEVEVADETFRQWVRLQFASQPLPPREGAAFRPIVGSLDFIKKKEAWPAYLRKALVPVSDADLARMTQAVAQCSVASAQR